MHWASQIAAVVFIAAMPRVCIADQSPAAPGRLSTVSYHALSAGAQIAVAPLDDSPVDLAVGARIREELRREGRAAANDRSDVTLTFQIKVESETRDEPNLADTRSGSGSTDLPDLEDRHWEHLHGSVDAEAHVSVLPLERTHSAKATSVAPTYVLTAIVDDTKTGQRLWQGEVAYRGAIARDDTTAFISLVPWLVQEIGHTVRGGRFRLN